MLECNNEFVVNGNGKRIDLKSCFPNSNYKTAKNRVSAAHRIGYSSPFLRGLLHVFTNGASVGNEHDKRYLTGLELLSKNKQGEFKVTKRGISVLKRLNENTTASHYIWAQEIVEKAKGQEKVASVLKPATLEAA